ncbi:MAG: hypothetical protein C0198_04425 [Sulfurihydrogenibium sp.]|nr:MAG: hypothetical protein C0198_04425 [Sulfurihydrogenibium sp.]
MLENINIITKILISLTLLAYVYFFDYDYKKPLIALIFAYIVGSFILNPILKNRILKFFVYFFDLVMLSYFSYATGNSYFSLFYFLLILPEKNIKDYIILSLISIPTIAYNFYQTNFYDFTYVALALGITLFGIKNIIFSKNLEETVESYVSKTKESFINYLRCKSKSEFYRKFYDVSATVNLFKKGKVSPEYFGSFLYKNLNVDCVLIYDKQSQECYTYGCKYECQDIFNENLEEKIYINETINNKTGNKYILVKFFNDYILLLVYKEYILDEDEIINLIVR